MRSIHTNQLYFYVLVTNTWKMKFKKCYLYEYSGYLMSSHASLPLHKLFPLCEHLLNPTVFPPVSVQAYHSFF